MSKVTVLSNWRVEVRPDLRYMFPTDEQCRSYCKDILEQVKRHVDYGSASIEVDQTEECSFCGYLWENAIDDDGKPGCCAKAVDEWETQHPDSQQFGVGA